MRKAEVWLMAVAAAAAIAFVAIGIDRPIWADETNAVRMARTGVAGLVAELRQDNNFPAYYVLLCGWMKLFGESEAVLRALSVVFYLAGAAAVALLGWTAYRNRATALYSAVLYLASAQVIRQAHAVRMYTMLGALAALSLTAYLRRRRALWVAVNCLGVLTQVWFFFLLAAQAISGGMRRAEKLLLAIPAAVFAAVWGRVFLAQMRNGSTRWFPPFRAADFADVWVRFYEYREVALAVFGSCLLALAIANRASIRAFLWERSTRTLVISAAACIALPLAISVFKPIYYPGRYTTIAFPAIAVLMGVILERFARRGHALAVCYGVLAAGLGTAMATQGGTVFGNLPPEHSDRTSAEYLLGNAASGDAVVFTGLTRTAADYYLRRRGAADQFWESSFPEELDRHPGWRDNQAMLRDPPALETEAAALAGRLAAMARAGHRVWLYYGQDLEVADLLKHRLDAEMLTSEQKLMRGPCHNFVVTYQERGHGGSVGK